MAAHGQNVWYDFMSLDPDKAKAFYGETLGWKTEPYSDADPDKPYTMWKAGDRPIGGLMELPKEAQEMGAPPHWLAYTQVDDVDAATKKAEKLGGRVYKEPWDIPTVGRCAVLADPLGAVFALYKPVEDAPMQKNENVGEISWAELNTSDYEAAWKFYSDLFGWEHSSSMDMGEGNTYFMWKTEEGTKGGMSNAATQMKVPPHWLYYVNVDDCDAACERIKKHGGKILNGPMDIPGDDRIAQCMDPEGGMFAIYSSGKKA